jgi:hypothetical protein
MDKMREADKENATVELEIIDVVASQVKKFCVLQISSLLTFS